MINKAMMIFISLMIMPAITGIATASTNTYFLTHSNIAEINNNVNVTVIINDVSRTISVQVVPPFPTDSVVGQPRGIVKFFYNLNNPINFPGMTGDSSWVILPKLPAEASGFGKFPQGGQHPSGTAGIQPSDPIVFPLLDPIPFSLNIPQNDDKHKATIAVMVKFDGCTGWVSDGIISPTGINPCKPKTNIPEFPTIALPVIAVIGLMLLFQKRKGK